MPHTLPRPDENALAASRALVERICAQAGRAGGALPFDRFMELVLYAPGLGYYSGGSRKFGAAGDFVTAPEISPLFPRCVAVHAAQVLRQVAGGVVLEFGAGSGALASGMLAELAKRDALPEAYLILELSGELRDRQYRRLRREVPDLVARVHWLDRLPDAPVAGVVVANEVLDAFPVHCFRVTGERIESLRVRCSEGELNAEWQDAPAAVDSAVRELRQAVELADGYRSEVCMRVRPWVESVASVLSRGAVLLIDYGYPRSEYYHPARRQGTLLCHYRHRAHEDPLFLPGLQDITAHVDFTAVAEAALAAGLEVAGFTTQARFLTGCGIEKLLAEACDEGTETGLKAAGQARQLLLPAAMGERFKAMVLSRGLEGPLAGFAAGDMRHRL